MCSVWFFQGHLSPSQFVVTEWPLKHTIPPFWRMVIDMRFDVIIVIGSPGHFSKVSTSKLLYTIAYPWYPYSRAQTYLNKITTSAWAPNQFSKTQAVVFLNLKFIASFCRTFCSFFFYPCLLFHIRSWGDICYQCISDKRIVILFSKYI